MAPSEVTCGCFTFSGKRLAVGTSAGEVGISRVPSFQNIWSRSISDAPIECIAPLTEDKFVFASGDMVYALDCTTNQIMKWNVPAMGRCTHIAVNPSSTKAALSCVGGNLTIVHLRPEGVAYALECNSSSCFLQDNVLVYAKGRDVLIHDLDELLPMHTMRCSQDPLLCACSNDGSILATLSSEKNLIVWDTHSIRDKAAVTKVDSVNFSMLPRFLFVESNTKMVTGVCDDRFISYTLGKKEWKVVRRKKPMGTWFVSMNTNDHLLMTYG